jgi:uncharacterized membrane protein
MSESVEPERVERSEDDDDDPPWILSVAGDVGIKLAVVSLLTTIVGIVAMYLNVYPYGRLLLTVSLAGVSVAMVFAVAYQAYVGDATVSQDIEP